MSKVQSPKSKKEYNQYKSQIECQKSKLKNQNSKVKIKVQTQ